MSRKAFAVGTALAAIALASTANAQNTGVAACDDFLKKYETCVGTQVPAAQRATFQAQLDQMKKAWTDAAKNAAVKPTLEASCKQSAEQMQMALKGFGCTF